MKTNLLKYASEIFKASDLINVIDDKKNLCVMFANYNCHGFLGQPVLNDCEEFAKRLTQLYNYKCVFICNTDRSTARSLISQMIALKNKKVVFYVPHQDDESSYFGQTIGAAVKKLGAENVHLVVMTKGNSSAVYIRDNKIPAEKDTSLEENKGKITYLDEPVNNDMLKSYGYVDNNGNASFMMARDAEFRNSMKALGIPKNNYVFAEELVGKNGTTHIDRFDDKSLSKNTEHVKNIMKYYDNLYNHDVTHITYTFLDAHTDHNTLGRCLNELYFDTTLDDKSFENVYSIVKFTENHVIDSRYLITLKNKENFESQLNSFKAYEMDESNKILGIGYRSADHIFNTFVERIKNNTLETTIHIPFKK